MDDVAPKETGEAKPDVTGEAGPPPESGSGGGIWRGIALFLMGIVVGVLGLAIFNAGTSGARVFARPTPAPALDAVAMRSAARQGTLDAIATLQATGPQAQAPQAQPTAAAVPANAFALRETNRIGNKDAAVTIVEFSDFQ
jgi:protein-disulfide isomerase